MNPHFIFNALNSIQFFISNNERHRAIQYLSTFSKLIRGILVGSSQSNVLLSDDIDLLKHYVDLEQVRFENKFTTSFIVHPDIDLTMQVPSLLIQPFVENAIVHGLSNLKQDGILKISIAPHDADHIVIEIEDNGIGREAAKKLQRVSQKRHKSMGISLAEERLKAINKHSQLAIETEDLYVDHKPAGTRVRIWLMKT
jgi:LytS/YehU family sensor histidine kinase